MSEIPEDIRKEGERIWREYHSTRLVPYDLPLEISKSILAERERCLAEADHFLSDIQISIDGRSRFDIGDINRQANKAVRYVRDRISGDYEKNWSSVSHPSTPTHRKTEA